MSEELKREKPLCQGNFEVRITKLERRLGEIEKWMKHNRDDFGKTCSDWMNRYYDTEDELEKYKRLVERIEKISSESPSSYFEVDKEEWQELKKEILGEKND